MCSDITEMRINEMHDAIEYAKAFGCIVEREQIYHSFSLITRNDDGEIICLALCVGHDHAPDIHTLIMSKPEASQELVQSISDKSLMKLNASQHSKFRIELFGNIEGNQFWPANNWLGQLDIAGEQSITEKSLEESMMEDEFVDEDLNDSETDETLNEKIEVIKDAVKENSEESLAAEQTDEILCNETKEELNAA